MIKAYKYKMYPTPKEKKILEKQFESCRYIYNTCISIKKITYEQIKQSLNYYYFQKQIPSWKETYPELKEVHSQVFQDVLKRVDKSYQGFFRRIKSGDAPGYPRYKNKNRYDSITYPQYGNGCYLEGNVLHLSKIGDIKVVLHRPINGIIKTVTIKRTPTGKWYAIFVVEEFPNTLQPNDNAIGIDVGLKSFVKFNNGDEIPNPKFFKQEEFKLKKLQSKKDKLKTSEQRKKLSKKITYLHENISNKRSDFIHKLSREIVNKYSVISVEKLDVKNMMEKSYFSKSIGDAAWTQFRNAISYKAVEAGRNYIEVDPAYTSQTCSSCGNRKKLELKDRIYECDCCDLKIDRDQNAAINILTVGLHSLNLIKMGFRSPWL